MTTPGLGERLRGIYLHWREDDDAVMPQGLIDAMAAEALAWVREVLSRERILQAVCQRTDDDPDDPGHPEKIHGWQADAVLALLAPPGSGETAR